MFVIVARTSLLQQLALSSAMLLVPLIALPERSVAQQFRSQPSSSPVWGQNQTLVAFEPLIPSPKKSRGGGRRLFEPPTGQDAPGTSRGGGRRTDEVCPQDRPKNQNSTEAPERKTKTLNERLTPLLPSNRWGLTAAERPTFLVYIPKTSARAMEFTLEDDKGEVTYQMLVKMPSTPGVVRLPLPEVAPALEVGKEYTWRVAFACQSMIPAPEDPFIQGVIQRSQTTTLPALTPGKPISEEQALQYAKAGFWYDASAGIAALKQSKPNDPTLQATWQDLLENVGLEALAAAPLKN